MSDQTEKFDIDEFEQECEEGCIEWRAAIYELRAQAYRIATLEAENEILKSANGELTKRHFSEAENTVLVDRERLAAFINRSSCTITGGVNFSDWAEHKNYLLSLLQEDKSGE